MNLFEHGDEQLFKQFKTIEKYKNWSNQNQLQLLEKMIKQK